MKLSLSSLKVDALEMANASIAVNEAVSRKISDNAEAMSKVRVSSGVRLTIFYKHLKTVHALYHKPCDETGPAGWVVFCDKTAKNF